jgi:pyruvate formate lyase activating enzyme
MATLADQLARQTRESELHRPLDRNRVECFACGHRCPIGPGFAGVCKVRYNRDGKLYAPWGYVNAAYCDPIEKKPFFHALPGSRALSFGMLGCDLHCGYCQNWVSSQALRDFRSTLDFRPATPQELVKLALRQGASSLVSTYNEPLITAEWAVAVFREAKAAGLTTGFVSNGNATPEVLEYIRPWVDLYKVDLKSFDDRRYHELGGRIQPILDSIRRIHEMGFWLEVVTLVVPGFNDSDDELRRTSEFLAGISADIPWHVTAFHKDYKMTGPEDTPAATLVRAAAIGRAAGLRYVYAGNLPGATRNLEDTVCPGCHAAVIERRGFRVLRNRMTADGGCAACGRKIPGVWAAEGEPAPAADAHHLIHIRCG